MARPALLAYAQNSEDLGTGFYEPSHLQYDFPAGYRALVISRGGTGASDSQGNSYSLLFSVGPVNIYSAHITNPLTRMVDEVYVANSLGYGVHITYNVDPTNPVDTSVTASGSYSGTTLEHIETPLLTTTVADTLPTGIVVIKTTDGPGPAVPFKWLPFTFNPTQSGYGSVSSSDTQGTQVNVLAGQVGVKNLAGSGYIVGADLNYGGAGEYYEADWWLLAFNLIGASDGGGGGGGGGGGSLGAAPCNLESRDGLYFRALIDGGNVVINRSDVVAPPYDLIGIGVTSGGTDEDPHLAREWGGRLWCLFTRVSGSSRSVYECYSDDDGASWSTPTLAFSGGKYSVVIVDPNPLSQVVLRAAYVGGIIKGRLQYPGQASPGAEFTFTGPGGGAIAFADEPFSLAWAGDTKRRILLSAKFSGGTEVSDLVSTDDGQTWALAT